MVLDKNKIDKKKYIVLFLFFFIKVQLVYI
jgi:hypothetical protein